MKNGNESAVATVTDKEQMLAFLKFLSEFLLQFTRKAEALSMHQTAYFLSMAAADTSDTLNKLAASPELQTTVEPLKRAS